MSALFRALPSMDALLSHLEAQHPQLTASTPRPLLRDLATEFLDTLRTAIAEKTITQKDSLTLPALLPRMAAYVTDKARPHFRRVVNASGVVIHTNLGRSILADEAVKAVSEAAAHYSNLEFDLTTGERGSRYSHVEGLICKLTGAEAALVVNNNAAAVLLVLDTLCKGREVVVSRGQLVEIGGSFRIPEVMEKSGCTLKEVGATNRTHLRDYETAINSNTAAVMKVHTSNYRITGFTKDVPPEELSRLCKEHGLPFLEDLGSGNLCRFAAAGLPLLADEPTAQEALESGVDVVTFSGDKVLGGPQAGIIAGSATYVNRIKKNPLNRALRIDKLTLAALEATLRIYLNPQAAIQRIPTLRMIGMPAEELRTRAQKLARKIRAAFANTKNVTVTTASGVSRVGGGAFPERDLPTFLVRVQSNSLSPNTLRERLLSTTPPVVARVEQNALCLDPRTLHDLEFSFVVQALQQAHA